MIFLEGRSQEVKKGLTKHLPVTSMERKESLPFSEEGGGRTDGREGERGGRGRSVLAAGEKGTFFASKGAGLALSISPWRCGEGGGSLS